MGLTILLVTCIINLALGLFVLFFSPRAGFARSFVSMSIMICLWIVANFMADYHIDSITINNIANKLSYVGAYSVVLSGLIFTHYFPVKQKSSSIEILLLSITTIAIIGLSLTNLIAGEATIDATNNIQFSTGELLWLYAIGFVVPLVYITKNMIRPSLYRDPNRRVQARLISIAFITSAVIGLLFSVILPSLSNDWSIAKFGPLSTIVLVIVIVYAIARHGLFDIKLAIVRTSAYLLSLLMLSVIYYLIAYIVSMILFNGSISSSVSISPVNIVLALLLAFIFQPIKRFFDKFTNKIFYKDNYNTDEFFARLNRIITLTTDLRDLLQGSANEIATTLKIDQAFFAVLKNDNGVISAGTDKHERMPHSDINKIDDYIQTNGSKNIIKSLLESGDADVDLLRMMTSHKIEIIIPLMLSDKRIGYLCLGDKKSSNFNTRDINVLETASDELTVAIQNALAVEEIREFNTTLQQRIANATKELRSSNAMLRRLDKAKDEFVSMASHQLRTPLTSVKGYISMVIDGDVGKVNDQQKHLLEEAFSSSERMVHLISDFLNVSRLQTGKFVIDKQPTDLARIVNEEMESLLPNATARNLKIDYKVPVDFPMLNLDEGKIRQVVMNFADNALYYSHEGTTIDIDLTIEGDDVVYTVKDNGIGVPRAEQSQLFTKFYRASNARTQRPDGTGVGLYLAKKVIHEHGGEVIFKTIENKGSTFGFRLPLDKLKPTVSGDL